MLTGEKFVAKLHLKQSGFTYSACGLFTKHRERIKKFRETCILKDLYRNELDKACVAHDATYSNSKDIAKKLLQIARNCNYDGYQGALASMVYRFFEKENMIRNKCQ